MSFPHDSDLVVMDPIEAVKRLEARMFRAGRFDPWQAMSYLVEEALLCGARDVGILRMRRWLVIHSNTDWLREAGRDVANDAFGRITSYQAGGDNSMRPEVLLTAFSPGVFTIRRGKVSVIKGHPEPFLEGYPEIKAVGTRVVGYLIPGRTLQR